MESILKGDWVRSAHDTFLVRPRGSGLEFDEPGCDNAAEYAEDYAAAAEHPDRAAGIIARTRSEVEQIIDEAARQALELRRQVDEEISAERERAAAELAAQRAVLESELRSELEAEYRERFATVMDALEGAAKQYETEREALLLEIEGEALSFVLDTTRCLLGREISFAPDFIRGQIARALEMLRPATPASLLLAPQTLELLFSELAPGDELQIGRWRSRLHADPALQPGQFSLSVGGSTISYDPEASFDEALALIAERSGLLECDSAEEPADTATASGAQSA